MKVIDLLNKIANGEEVPDKIYYDGNDYKLVEYGETTKLYQCLSEPYELINIKTDRLTDEIEIIEDILKEDKKIPEKLKMLPDNEHYSNKILYGTINGIIDYLKSKGDE